MNNKDTHHSGNSKDVLRAEPGTRDKDQIFLCVNHSSRANRDTTALESSVTPAGELVGCFQSGLWKSGGQRSKWRLKGAKTLSHLMVKLVWKLGLWPLLPQCHGRVPAMHVSVAAIANYHNLRVLTGHKFITDLEVRLRNGSAGLHAICRDNLFPCPAQIPEVTYSFSFMAPFLYPSI